MPRGEPGGAYTVEEVAHRGWDPLLHSRAGEVMSPEDDIDPFAVIVTCPGGPVS